MTSRLEQRYRLVLRLLPPGYRRQWEQDMVASFLDSAERSNSNVDNARPRLDEVLSVAVLALRLRFTGRGASARTLAWYHSAQALALLVLLVDAVLRTYSIIFRIAFPPPDTGLVDLLTARRLDEVLLIGAFGALVFDRIRTARVLAVLGLGAALWFEITSRVTISRQAGALTPPPITLIFLAVLAVAVVALFAPPLPGRRPRWLWFGFFLLGLAAVTPGAVITYTAVRGRRLDQLDAWVEGLNPVVLMSLVLAVAMVVAIRRIRDGREPSPHWVFALAVCTGVIGLVGLVESPPATRFGVGESTFFAGLSSVLDVVLTGLAVTGVIVGFLALRRLADRDDVLHSGQTPAG